MNAALPARLTRDFEPVSGLPITIRPLTGNDRAIHDRFVHALSARTLYNRLLGGACRFTLESYDMVLRYAHLEPNDA